MENVIVNLYGPDAADYFNAAREAIMANPDDVSDTTLKRLAMAGGLDENAAHMLVTAVGAVVKQRVKAEVRKHTETMLFFLELA